MTLSDHYFSGKSFPCGEPLSVIVDFLAGNTCSQLKRFPCDLLVNPGESLEESLTSSQRHQRALPPAERVELIGFLLL